MSVLNATPALMLGVREVLADIPHDAGAIVVYLMLLALGFFVWHGSRNKGAPPSPPTSPS